jgi:PAS domain S-box-containing protein
MPSQGNTSLGKTNSRPVHSSQVQIGLCYFDTDLRYVEINEWLAALNGLAPTQHVGRTIRDILPSVADSVEGQLRQVIRTGEPILKGLAWAETAAHPGTERLYQHDYYADKAPDGTVLGVECTVQDITHQRLAEVTGIIPWEADARTWEFSYVGPQTEEVLGYPAERWYESGFRDSCIHPDDRQRVIDQHSTSPRERQHYELEYRMIKADRTSTWLRDVVDVHYNGGEPIIVRGFMFDISALREAQEQAEQNEARLQRFLDTAPDALVLVRPDGTIVFANEQVETVLGYRPDELTGAAIETLIPHRLRRSHASHQHGFLAEPTTRSMGEGMALSALRKDGVEVPVEISLSSVGSGEDVIVTAAIRDVSKRVEREQALCAASQEIEELGRRLKQENRYLREQTYRTTSSEGLVGDSDLIREVSGLVDQVAPTVATVLITGETGTGKELVARSVYAQSSRADRLLVQVNCATLPSNLIESELFGHEKGAFTGAVRQRVGRFELADGGTIFLDEIGDLPLELQSKLLRVLQEGEFERLGSTKTMKVDVRVIAATNRDLDQAVAAGEFRKDLYYRLHVFPIHVPPLRERPSDIPLLVWYFLSHTKLSLGRPVESVSDDVMQRFERYQWPGNVRELENVVERAVILTKGPSLQLEESFGRSGGASPLAPGALGDRSTRLEDVERAHIVSVLQECGWYIKGRSNAAERLGLHPSTLLHRMKKLGVERPSNNRQMAAPNGPPQRPRGAPQ